MDEDSTLLQTIHIPKNLLVLAGKLPGSNYNSNKNESSSSIGRINLSNASRQEKTVAGLAKSLELKTENENFTEEVKLNKPKKVIRNVRELETKK